MRLRVKRWEMLLPITLDEAWQFFSRPENLARITPTEMQFEVLSEIEGVPMYPGMIIQYKLRPLLGIPANWVTEITHVQEPHYFVDEQRFGPYQCWHHEHHFKEQNGQTLMTDILHYSIPFGILGRWMDAVIVHRKVNQIFAYRESILNKIFNQ